MRLVRRMFKNLKNNLGLFTCGFFVFIIFAGIGSLITGTTPLRAFSGLIMFLCLLILALIIGPKDRHKWVIPYMYLVLIFIVVSLVVFQVLLYGLIMLQSFPPPFRLLSEIVWSITFLSAGCHLVWGVCLIMEGEEQ